MHYHYPYQRQITGGVRETPSVPPILSRSSIEVVSDRITLIAAIDKNRGIGINNAMPWHIPEDFLFFKEMTLNNIVVMGRKTHESVGVFKNRVNIVITDNQEYIDKNNEDKPTDLMFVNMETYDIMETMLRRISGKEIFIIGGQKIYEHFLPRADRILLTEIDHKFNCDTFFPELSNEWFDAYTVHSSNELYRYKFVEYQRLDLSGESL